MMLSHEALPNLLLRWDVKVNFFWNENEHGEISSELVQFLSEIFF